MVAVVDGFVCVFAACGLLQSQLFHDCLAATLVARMLVRVIQSAVLGLLANAGLIAIEEFNCFPIVDRWRSYGARSALLSSFGVLFL